MHRLCQCLLLLFTLVLAGCATSYDNEFGMASNGQTLTLSPGEKLSIELGANLANESTWNLVQLDQSVVKMEKAHRPEAIVPTGGLARLYLYKYDLRAVSKGETTLYMEQTSADSEEPVQTFTVHFVVE